jgi:hypothetical protein
MNDRNAPWYNLNEICRLAGRLSEPQSQVDASRCRPNIQFRTTAVDRSHAAANVSHVQSETTPSPVSDISPYAPAETSLEPAHSWEKLVAWCMVVANMEVAFAVDSQGFIIASVGTPPHEGFEGLGAEICYLMEEMERIDPAAGSLLWTVLQCAQHFLIGYKVVSEKIGTYYLGMLGSRPVPLQIRKTIQMQVLQSLEVLQ